MANEELSDHQYAFFKKNRKGKVIKLVKEKYLRSDLELGYRLGEVVTSKKLNNILNQNVSANKHILVLDKSTCLYEIDVLEYNFRECPVAIILQSVLQALKTTNLSCYKRISALLADTNKNFIFYPNELSQFTIEFKKSSENAVDFYNRLIKRSLQFYYHQQQVKITFITSNSLHKEMIKDIQIPTYTMNEYIHLHFSHYPELFDLLSSTTPEMLTNTSMEINENSLENINENEDMTNLQHQQLTYYSYDYQPLSDIEASIQRNKCYKTILRCDRNDYHKCYGIIYINSGNNTDKNKEDTRISVQILGHENVNRAIDGDTVAIEILSNTHPSISNKALMDNDTTTTPIHQILDTPNKVEVTDLVQEATFECIENVVDTTVNTGNTDLSSIVDNPNKKVSNNSSSNNVTSESSGQLQPLYGRVIGIMKRNRRQYAGSLMDLEDYLKLYMSSYERNHTKTNTTTTTTTTTISSETKSSILDTNSESIKTEDKVYNYFCQYLNHLIRLNNVQSSHLKVIVPNNPNDPKNKKNSQRDDSSMMITEDSTTISTTATTNSADTTSTLPPVVDHNSIDIMIFIPVDTKIPPIFIRTRRRHELLYHRILVSIDDWPLSSVFPWGHYVQTIGKDGDKGVETQVLLHEFGVSHEAFSNEVMACLPTADWKITKDIITQRTDLRYLPVVSIDPPGCKDIDDALHCIPLSNGNFQIGVHIADVTHFVHPDTPLDKEASHRSTSTYLVEKRLDMLPSLLTTELCSLRSNEDHLSFSVLWEFTKQGDIVNVDFCKSVIHSVGSLTYDDAQKILDDKTSYEDPIKMIQSNQHLNPFPLPTTSTSTSSTNTTSTGAGTSTGKMKSQSKDNTASTAVQLLQDDKNRRFYTYQSVKLLNYFAHILRDHRIELGALTLASPEVRFSMDSETQSPTDVNMYQLKESNALVEEFMLLANITVSKQILRYYPTLSVLRRHQPPSLLQFQQLLKYAQSLDISTSKTLADSLDRAIKENDPYFNKLLRIMSTRCMKPAQYFCSGEIPKHLWHHYGLAAPVYTHFTSPIRRYADIIVHRLLAASIGVISLPPANADRTRQQDLCAHMNRRHKAAQYVQRASTNLHTILFFKNRPLTIDTAYILNISMDKITAFVPKFALEGTIHLTPIAQSIHGIIVFDDLKFQVLIQHEDNSSQVLYSLQIFQQINVQIQVKETIVGHRQLEMTLILPSTITKKSQEKNDADSMNVEDNDVNIRKRYYDSTGTSGNTGNQGNKSSAVSNTKTNKSSNISNISNNNPSSHTKSGNNKKNKK